MITVVSHFNCCLINLICFVSPAINLLALAMLLQLCLLVGIFIAVCNCSTGKPVCDAGNRRTKGCLKTEHNQGVDSITGGNHAVNYIQVEGDTFAFQYPYTMALEKPELAVEFNTNEFKQFLVFPFKVKAPNPDDKRVVLKRNILIFSMIDKFYPILRIYHKEQKSGSKAVWSKMKVAKDFIPDPPGHNKVPNDPGARYYELDDESDYLAVVGTVKGDKNLESSMDVKNSQFLVYFTSDTGQYWAPINGLWFNGTDIEKAHHANEKATYDFNTKNHGKATIYGPRHKNENGTFNPTMAYINPMTKSLRIYFTHGVKWHCKEESNGRRSAVEFVPNDKGLNDQLKGSSNFPDTCLMNIRMQNNIFKTFVEKVLGSVRRQLTK